ncbi:MAG: rod shape-determining protein [Peptoniphilaceae bacterium]|nr:rod shape-determining protein [Peptoniphilaceae bacterium]MDD7382764.1 rod shape-determining protein [Peptoniphilaceae bacterium]MDY3737920.1 rod shape-determining protein [Peptoniphilaceae bacterium]
MATFRKKIAIDLGTASVLVYYKNRVILQEPSVIAIDKVSKKILAVGREAKKLLGRTPGNIIAMRPLKDGVISDFRATEEMLKYFIEKSVKKSLFSPDVLICIPSKATQVEKRAVIQASQNAGAHQTYLIDEPLAAAIGAGVDISDAAGNLVIDIGGGTCDIAVISMGKIVVSDSVDIGGDIFDDDIVSFVRERYGILIGYRSAEKIKIRASSVDENESIEIRGREMDDGLPMQKYIPIEEIENALKYHIDEIINALRRVLEETPPEIAADLYERGIILTGGASLTRSLKQRMESKIQIPVKIAENPVQCVIKGTGKALIWLDSMNEDQNEIIKAQQHELEKRERLRRR